MSTIDRGELHSLITYLGMSQQEAARYIGISPEALSRKLAGKPRYDVRPDEIAKLEQLRTIVDRMVEAGARTMRDQVLAMPADDDEAYQTEIGPVRLLIYRSEEDFPPWNGLPFASVHRMAMARIANDPVLRELTAMVAFDRAEYEAYRAGREDTSELRSEWACMQSTKRLGLKLHSNGVGWALINDPEIEEDDVRSKVSGSEEF